MSGWWWVPENPEYRIPGILEIDEDNRFKLTTTEGPKPINELFQIKYIRTNETVPIINGIAKDSESNNDSLITLAECSVIQYSGSKLIKTTYSIQYVVMDYHFVDLSEICATEVYVKPQFIDNWISDSNFQVETQENQDKFEYSIHYSLPDPVHIFHDNELSIYLNYRASAPWLIISEAVLTQSIFVNIEFHTFKKFAFIQLLVDKIRNWFAIAFSLPIRILVFELRLSNEIQEGVNNHSKKTVTFLVSDNNTYTSRNDLNSRNMVISFNDLILNSQKYFHNWFDKYETLAPSLKIYSDTIYNINLYPQNQFLNYVFALEIYHRRTNFEAIEIKSKHHEKIEKIAAKIIDMNEREYIRACLSKKNPVNLKTRLLDLFEKHQPVIESFILDIDEFLDKVISTRHRLVHLADPKDSELILDGKNLTEANSKLKIMLQLVYLHEMGFSNEQISQQIRRPFQHKKYFEPDK